jgi:iron complex outermembrane receptor protein
MKIIPYIIFFFAVPAISFAQQADTIRYQYVDEILVTSSRQPVVLRKSLSSVSLITAAVKKTMPRSIGAEEALRLVPGVRVENQANGSRLHMSIRGQGILSERGLRGIRVLIDGIPVNDPTGFAADLYDVDWAVIDQVEMLRGPVTSLYGGSAAAGVLNIKTENGGLEKLGGKVMAAYGSNSFYKTGVQFGGTQNNLNYRLGYSRMGGLGYRDHTGFWGNNLSEKITWKVNEKLTLRQLFLLTDYFNQNAEGLSISQVQDNPLQANPDANPFNEYQKTNRVTQGLTGTYDFSEKASLDFYAFYRLTRYKETSNKSAQYRLLTSPGAGLQFNHDAGQGRIANHFSAGADLQWQQIGENKFKSLSNPDRKESLSETNVEDTLVLANQVINQSSAGLFITDRVDLGEKISLTASLRYDYIHNELADKLSKTYNLSGTKNFEHLTGKIGLGWFLSPVVNIHASLSQGFMPPATEELASNPVSFAGFNENLVPATSLCSELGLRGSFKKQWMYDLTAFYMTTENDFFRFKLYPARGNQEVFYGNTGSTQRTGFESYIGWNYHDHLKLQLAYTFQDFTYSSPDTLDGLWLPNCPKHQLVFDAEARIGKKITVGISPEYQSKWYIYTDVIHKDVSQEGYTLLGARIGYHLTVKAFQGDITLSGRNLGNTEWVAFTEPDPDGNCYQPGAGREFFVSFIIRF